MQSIGDASLVGANTANLNGIRCIGRATISECRTDKRDDMVAPRKNQISDKTLISVDHEVSAEFFWLLVVTYEVG